MEQLRENFEQFAKGIHLRPKGADCENCTLSQCAIVPGRGPQQADIVIVGEAPGTQEVHRGRPFVGKSGQLLDELLASAGIDRQTCYITNAVLCRPWPHRMPSVSEIKACNKRLLSEINERKPKVVVAMGAAAYKALTGKSGIKKARGGAVPYQDGSILIATYHPAAVLRNPSLYPDLQQDLQQIPRLLGSGLQQIGNDVKYIEVNSYHDLPMPEDTPGGVFFVDVETDSVGNLLCIWLKGGYATPVYIVTQQALNDPKVRYHLSELFRSDKLIGHNLKFDIKALWRAGIAASIGADTMLMHYTLDERQGIHGLKHLAQQYFHAGDYDAEVGQFMKAGLETCPPEILHKYNAKDVFYTAQLHAALSQQLTEDEQGVLNNLLYPAANVLAKMEYLGITVDVPRLQKLQTELGEEIEGIKAQMFEAAGREFNPNSHPQLMQLLYRDLNLPVPGKFSADEESLKMIQDFHPLPKLLLEYRGKKKMLSTYAEGLLEAADEQGRVHTNFNLHTTQTGRLSSSNPINLQNIPKRDPEQKERIRSLFVASPGYKLVELDYSNAELRVLACLSKDPKLIEAFCNGEDLHRKTASLIYNKHLEEVTDEERSVAKTINFAILYGAGPNKIAQQIGTTVEEAARLIALWFEAYPSVREWIRSVERSIPLDGVVKTVFGRKRRFPYLTKQNYYESLRQGVNFPIQSTASDLTLYSLIQAGTKVDWDSTRLLLTVHDAILLETQDDPAYIGGVIKWLMTLTPGVWGLHDVPFEVEVSVGDDWGHMEEIKV